MTANTDKYQEDDFKLYGRAHQAKNNDLKYSATIRGGRICCRKDTPRFCGVTHRTTIVRPTAYGTVTPTSSTKNEQTENTVYAFYYYQITGQDRNCNCYVCADLAEFKPKKQNDAIVAVGGFAAAGRKQQLKRRRTYV